MSPDGIAPVAMLDPANKRLAELDAQAGRQRFGLMNNQVWSDDPKRLIFTLARYKFVAKMMVGKNRVLEVGCGDGMGARIVRQAVPHVSAIDIEPEFIADIERRHDPKWPLDARLHDILAGPLPENFDGVYALDVFEHVAPDRENEFIGHLIASLATDGIVILGIPSLESQAYASPASKTGHVNCKSGEDFRTGLLQHFHNVFLFSMNDEVIHTGFTPMAHYLIAVCCQPRSKTP